MLMPRWSRPTEYRMYAEVYVEWKMPDIIGASICGGGTIHEEVRADFYSEERAVSALSDAALQLLRCRGHETSRTLRHMAIYHA